MSHPALRLLLGFVALALATWGVGELWLSVAGSAEAGFMREVAQQRSSALVETARVVTWAGSAYLLVPLALAVCLALVHAGLRREALAIALSLGGAMLLSDLDKLLVSRARPAVAHLESVTGSSFPSGHTTQASAFWFSLALAVRAAGAPKRLVIGATAIAAVLAPAVAASRVILGVHYPSDVLAGLILGASWALLVARVVYAAARG